MITKNQLTIRIYTSTGTVQGWGTPQNITFGTLYPGGFGEASFYIPWDVTGNNPIVPGLRVKIYNGLTCVYEGKVTGIEYSLQSAEQGINVSCTGYWGAVLMARKWRKPWADQRIEDGVWTAAAYDANTHNELYSINRDNRIMLQAQTKTYSQYYHAALKYTAPTGETIKAVSFTADVAILVGQSWLADLRDAGGTALKSYNASGPATESFNLVTPTTALWFLLIPLNNYAIGTNEDCHFKITSLTVYTETGLINLTEIAKDVRAKVTELSANEGLIADNSYSLVPFISDPPLSYADILMTAAGYGDNSYNPWAVGVWESDLGTDDKPVLFAEQQPALTDYDLALRLDETVIPDSVAFTQNLDEVKNWIAYSYNDASGRTVFVTPDDDVTLKDTTSITAYGQRDEWLSINTQSASVALNYAKRYLAKYKDAQWRSSGDIVVSGAIRAKNGNVIPASQVRAGMRVKIENYLNDLSGTGLTLLITATNYDDASETVSISTGKPDSLATWLARETTYQSQSVQPQSARSQWGLSRRTSWTPG